MTLTMIFGSFIAGASSEGGGAIAFPVMTLLFKIAPTTARDFSIMIQSFGMIAATLSILIFRIKILKDVLPYILIGATIGLFIGFQSFQNLMSPSYLKIFFTSLWISFAFTLYRTKNEKLKKETLKANGILEIVTYIALGAMGGIVTSLTGSGVDIILFSFFTLNKDVCVKVATPTSVVIMGLTSAIAFLIKSQVYQDLSTEAINYLLVCIPVVVLGAPIGSLFINKRTKAFIQYFLITIIIFQYIGSLLILPMTTNMYVFSFLVIVLGLGFFNYKKFLSAKSS